MSRDSPLIVARDLTKRFKNFTAVDGVSFTVHPAESFGFLGPNGAGKTSTMRMERMDGQVFNNIRTALMKAQTSLQTRVPTSVYNAQGRNNPAGANRTIVQYDFFTNSGGIPIVVDGQMIGSVGVGGGAGGGGDENCAIEGLKATFGDHVTLPAYPAATTAAR